VLNSTSKLVRPRLPSQRPAPSLSIALAVAMGIGRFAFTPLLPLMVRDGALAPSAGAWLAASNYLGYLAGALTANRLGLSLPALMRVSLVGTVLTTVAMGAFDGLAMWAVLRFLAGVMSAWTLVATSAWVLQHLARAGRTDLSGIVYAGRRSWNRDGGGVLPRRRAARRASQSALAGAGSAGGPLCRRS
jgi:MFS family permease